ncbi:calponin homology domain-containing protein [Blyttiomyces helicus]|uniref:Calponin homology domain-containing protein n=1 Tax=Blyttiomyces helicus TaxID=388810 RepID=A0A4P9WKR7_9FUNG|nr:calponin homology domain-containing protein [Blyttiomyces helicus]|eukprot:RKO93414.1 calponin homology domain-containing protein [Blyttiomyces helicus]
MSGQESKVELLGWLNELLHLRYVKIQQCSNGAAFCQILDSIYGDVPMFRVHFEQGPDYEAYSNYKTLQHSFVQHGIEKDLPVESLVRGSYRELLELLQWLKKFWDTMYPGGSYNPISRREIQARVRRHSRPATTQAPATTSMNSSGMESGTTVDRQEQQLINLNSALHSARSTIENMQAQVNEFQRDRNFYYGKLERLERVVVESFASAKVSHT